MDTTPGPRNPRELTGICRDFKAFIAWGVGDLCTIWTIKGGTPPPTIGILLVSGISSSRFLCFNKKLRQQLRRKSHIKIELCVKCFAVIPFWSRFTKLSEVHFHFLGTNGFHRAKNETITILLRARVVVRNSKMRIWQDEKIRCRSEGARNSLDSILIWPCLGICTSRAVVRWCSRILAKSFGLTKGLRSKRQLSKFFTEVILPLSTN